MATSEERLKILKMVQEGKISAEEGARLLAALRESRRERPSAETIEARRGWLRVRVTDMATGKTKVNVNLPLGLLDAGLNIAGQFVPDLDLEQISEAIRKGMPSGKVVDVMDEQDGEHVEIFIE